MGCGRITPGCVFNAHDTDLSTRNANLVDDHPNGVAIRLSGGLIAFQSQYPEPLWINEFGALLGF